MAGRVGSVPASSRSQQQSPEDRRRGRRKGPGGGGQGSRWSRRGALVPPARPALCFHVLATWTGLALEIYCTVLEEAWGRGRAGAAGKAGRRQRSPLGLGVFSDLPDHQVHAGAGVLAGAVPVHCKAGMQGRGCVMVGSPPGPALPPRRRRPAAPQLTIVLDDLSEVVGHEVPQGALVGEAQAVREEHRRVHHGSVDDLWAGGWAETTGPGPQGQGRKVPGVRPSSSCPTPHPTEGPGPRTLDKWSPGERAVPSRPAGRFLGCVR